MHSCQSDLSREGIDGCAMGIGAKVEPVGAIAVAIFVVITDAAHCFALDCYIVSELTTEISSGHYYRLSRRAGGR
jgi:hypothetical protein